jgi:hypothetical protein
MDVLSRGYYVARTGAQCGHCGCITAVLALALPPNHETLDVDAEDADWQIAGANAFLFHVSDPSPFVRRRLLELSQTYRPIAKKGSSKLPWANHCKDCGSLLDDQELHCEPGTFMPMNEADAANIELIHIDEMFEAAAAGYALDPEFFSSMRRRWPSISSI